MRGQIFSLAKMKFSARAGDRWRVNGVFQGVRHAYVGKTKRCQVIKFTAAIKWKARERRGLLGLGAGGLNVSDKWTEGVLPKKIAR